MRAISFSLLLLVILLLLSGCANTPGVIHTSAAPSCASIPTTRTATSPARSMQIHIHEFAIPARDSVPGDITAGSDGALWFTEYGGNQIGRITTSGAITEYAIPPRTAVLRVLPPARTAPSGSQKGQGTGLGASPLRRTERNTR